MLVGEEANRWARAFAFSRAKPSGERVGVRRDGVAAATGLPARWRRIILNTIEARAKGPSTEAILNATIGKFMGRAPDLIVADDLAALKAAVEDWFSQNVVPRCYVVPCSLMPDLGGLPECEALHDRSGRVPPCRRLPEGEKFDRFRTTDVRRDQLRAAASGDERTTRHLGGRGRNRRMRGGQGVEDGATSPLISRSSAFSLSSPAITPATWPV